MTSSWMSIKQQLNHSIAKIDAGEGVRAHAPLRRFATPGLGVGLGVASLGYNYTHAPTPKLKQKVLVRDGLVLLGVSLTSVAAAVLLHRTTVAHQVARFFENRTARLLGQFSKKPQPMAHNHAHTGSCGHGLQQGASGRVQSLFKSSTHDHGWQGATELTLMAAFPIFLGALPFGMAADAINGENWKQTGAMKLKEGLFQFIGNITMCTVAILACTKLGKAASQALWKQTGLQQRFIKATQRQLESRVQPKAETLSLVPTHFTSQLEHLLLEHRQFPEQIPHFWDRVMVKAFSDRWVTGLGEQWDRQYLPKFNKLLRQKPLNHKAIHQHVQQFLAQAMKNDIQTALSSSSTIKEIAQASVEAKGELAGVITGVMSGVLGGAWVSNKLNEVLTKHFGLPAGHATTGLFGRKDAHQEHDNGWLAGTVGDRGLHWYDWILHLDDWPSALYMSGVHAVESLVQVLYGISGYLTGIAGTDYGNSAHNKHHGQAVPNSTNSKTLWQLSAKNSYTQPAYGPESRPSWGISQNNPFVAPYYYPTYWQ